MTKRPAAALARPTSAAKPATKAAPPATKKGNGAIPAQVTTASLRVAATTANIDQLAEIERIARSIGAQPGGLTMKAIDARREALHTRGS